MRCGEKWYPANVGAACVVLGIALVALMPALPASATVTTASPGPQLSIAIDNGRTSAAVGDRSTYTITVRNLGSTPVRGLLVTQTVPPGLSFTSADNGGKAEPDMVSWRLNLKATTKATLHTTMTVSKTPSDLLRLATVACARVAENGPPIVCSTHSDQLPAGASAAASKARASNEAKADETVGGGHTWYLAGGLGGTIVLVVAALTVRQRKHRLDLLDLDEQQAKSP